jgi:hypothetical protein
MSESSGVGGQPKSKRGGRRAGAGRKPIDFNLKELEIFGNLGCSHKTIAAYLGTTERTVQRRLKTDPQFAAALEHGDAVGCIEILRTQYHLLKKGNAAIAIHLGKVRCGQRYVTELSGTKDGAIQLSLEAFDVALEQANTKSVKKTR